MDSQRVGDWGTKSAFWRISVAQCRLRGHRHTANGDGSEYSGDLRCIRSLLYVSDTWPLYSFHIQSERSYSSPARAAVNQTLPQASAVSV